LAQERVSEMNVLAIDPAFGLSRYVSKTGFALFLDDKLVEYGGLSAGQAVDFGTRVNLLKQVTHLAIEDQWHGRNIQVMKGLVMAAAWWIVPAHDLFGHTIIRVSPQEWQKAVTRGWKFGRGSRKDNPAIEHYVRHRWGLAENVLLTPDMLSAICIGSVAMYREGIKG